MTHASLPLELLLSVAEYLTPPEATSPILVCRAWHNVFISVIWRSYSINALTQLPLDVLVNHSDLVTELTYKDRTIPQEYLSIPFTRLTHLALDSGSTGTFSEEAMSHFARLVALNDHLQEMVIYGQSFAAEDEFWSSVASRPHLRRLTLERCSMDSKGFAAFWRSLIRVEQLSIHRFRGIGAESFFCNELVALPALHSIDLDQLDTISLLRLSSRIIQGGPWVCTQLKVFKAEIVIKHQDQEGIRAQSRAVFERLSKLEDLTTLIIRGNSAESITRQGPDLRLESGLDQLSTLRNMRRLDFKFTKQNMSAEDVAWIKTHWRRLEQVEGRCNENGVLSCQPELAEWESLSPCT
ncbi:hypothetical protein BG000_003687 [Podila horticola]|nr:hypothetical protein BG000_003687 [Podila horticola]